MGPHMLNLKLWQQPKTDPNAAEDAAAPRVQRPLMKVAVLNTKGGCGKTTLSTSLAAYYASRGYNTAILSARYDIGPVRVGVEVNNLFDSRRVTNISTGKTAPCCQLTRISWCWAA